ncbi:hypothetical protein Rmf_10050 [Roseomonas fluvialis]|uniref:Uncharacterized protein n=1 Tax=Roseomonas fluvialis TaxID=1750527 RepID=A0ABN6NYJ6_9PROT|nr:hypothetical protein Rmf_10050 [Roseomonas fluvialis]
MQSEHIAKSAIATRTTLTKPRVDARHSEPRTSGFVQNLARSRHVHDDEIVQAAHGFVDSCLKCPLLREANGADPLDHDIDAPSAEHAALRIMLE